MSLPSEFDHLVRNDEPLSAYTWLGIGGPARYFAEPTGRDEYCQLIRAAHANDVPVRVLGEGSNLLVRESGFDGLVIHTGSASLSGISVEGSRLTAGCGAKLSHVITRVIGEGLGGLERLAGIPGTIGGAVMGNVSAGGTEIGSYVASVTCVDTEGRIEVKDRKQVQFGHRKSDLTGCYLLEVQFELEPSDTLELTKRLQKTWIVRRASRPTEHSRIALPLVDPDGADAASLIEQVGLKGSRRGGASLDPQHPAYLIAHPGCTSDDCLELLELVREQVSKQLAVDLQLNLVIW